MSNSTQPRAQSPVSAQAAPHVSYDLKGYVTEPSTSDFHAEPGRMTFKWPQQGTLMSALERRESPTQMARFRAWLALHRSLNFPDYAAMWAWSTQDLTGFWHAVWDFYQIQATCPFERVMGEARMPGVRWFEGARLNYVQQVFRHVAVAEEAQQPAILCRDERDHQVSVSWRELQLRTERLARALLSLGLTPGDRVVAYLPNTAETVIAFLACASVGAVWSVCAPDMGTQAVVDRFRQIEPKVLLACDGVVYGHREQSRQETVLELVQALPSLKHVFTVSVLGLDETGDGLREALAEAIEDADLRPAVHVLEAVLHDEHADHEPFLPVALPFDHPLWVVYSSGTTGLPKPMTHGHGGVLLVHLMQLNLHLDLGASYAPDTWGERLHWYSSTGWIMWNVQIAGLLLGTTICLYDGSPSGAKESPDWGVLWRFASDVQVSFFGAGSAFYGHCQKAGLQLGDCGDLARIHALGATGSPLALEAQRWGTQQFAELGLPEQWWAVISGGTDFAGAFVGANRELPQHEGAMQCRLLGCAVESWREPAPGQTRFDSARMALIGQVGELVCTAPLPSMPLYFWGDAQGERYRESYFELYPGVWRHGDWLELRADGSCVIYGRSDTTINRNGLRLGSSEIYRVIEAIPQVREALIVDLEFLGRESWMPLFVVLLDGVRLDRALTETMRDAIRRELSPRFLPDEIVQVDDIPKTLSGKKMELPVKKMLLGVQVDKVVSRDSMANPECLDHYLEYAQRYLQAHPV